MDVYPYHIPALSENKPEFFSKIIIDGKIYDSETVFDSKRAIAIIGSGEFTGKEVQFA